MTFTALEHRAATAHANEAIITHAINADAANWHQHWRNLVVELIKPDGTSETLELHYDMEPFINGLGYITNITGCAIHSERKAAAVLRRLGYYVLSQTEPYPA